ncbi:MAG: neutral/alkaline non-lysosomal ceramidase N-terminal domain-containing protein [Acidobacteria bacterium]|nr:neutral/alkaline non-lysosomal ceramidase N-terminal domain-containing protein [Acidobacteriota bacterium]MBI3424766.1 neutral/alkaline non-lysosomal ceramidase N-terminal domain-containing protein [Acidobacteriota bacterium]
MKRIFLVTLVLLCGALTAAAKPLKAGLARAVITPEQPTWLSGYAARNKPSEGKLHDLWVKALALEDERGNRVVLVTSDILGFSREVAATIAGRAQQQFGLRREQLMLNSSHTHTAPIVRSNLIGAYDLDAEQTARVAAFAERLQDQAVRVIGAALQDLAPAKISFGHGVGGFARNRRQRAADGSIRIGVNEAGPVDHDVPVLLIESEDGKTRGIVFGYACHNTTLTGEHYTISGDYAGFAQLAIEAEHPGATAMFVMGCGADINPYPRSKLENAQAHGTALAAVVTQVLQSSRLNISGTFKTAFERIALPFGPLPTREEFTARLNDKDVFKQRHAKRMLERYARDGKLAGDYPYTIQVFQLGKDFTLIGLAGEVVTDYVLRLKRELGARGLWVAGYTNEVMAYIPSARMFSEGGYEVVDSMIYYDQPASWSPALEEKIIGKTRELARRVGRKSTR